jgi:hypothetical protein
MQDAVSQPMVLIELWQAAVKDAAAAKRNMPASRILEG